MFMLWLDQIILKSEVLVVVSYLVEWPFLVADGPQVTGAKF